jgi:hypothetical protein
MVETKGILPGSAAGKTMDIAPADLAKRTKDIGTFTSQLGNLLRNNRIMVEDSVIKSWYQKNFGNKPPEDIKINREQLKQLLNAEKGNGGFFGFLKHDDNEIKLNEKVMDAFFWEQGWQILRSRRREYA